MKRDLVRRERVAWLCFTPWKAKNYFAPYGMAPIQDANRLLLWKWLLEKVPSMKSRWAALHECHEALHDDVHRQRCLHLCARIVERDHRWKLKLRRRAAIALLKLASIHTPESERLQAALARSLALALPRQLRTPRVVEQLLAPEDCATLMEEARASGEWTRLHRKYSTCDMPLDTLPSGQRVMDALKARALPEFVRHFGAKFGPVDDLQFQHGQGLPGLFIVRYTCEEASTRHPSQQRGLGGHVDESLLSMVITLSEPADFQGGGTKFEGVAGVARPGQGGAVLFLGKVWHEGVAITRGERFVLVGLVNRRSHTRSSV